MTCMPRAQALKQAFRTDVSAILAMARLRSGAAIDPVACYRSTGYREAARRGAPTESRRQQQRHRISRSVKGGMHLPGMPPSKQVECLALALSSRRYQVHACLLSLHAPCCAI